MQMKAVAVQKSMSGNMPDDKKVISSVGKIVLFLAWQGQFYSKNFYGKEMFYIFVLKITSL